MAVGLDDPVVVRPGEGEVIADSPSRWSRIKVARDELLLLEFFSEAGERGAAPHIHREHADAFFVLEGELAFHLAGEERQLSAGSFALAPPGLVHGFQIGPEGARCLNLHAPGARYAALSRARRDGVDFDPAEGDSFPPPEDGGLPATEAFVYGEGEGEQEGNVVKAARPEVSCLVLEIRPGGGVDPHFHQRHSDSFFVLDGELEIHLGERTVKAVPGTFALAPPGVVHYFRNVGDVPARALNLHTPGGFAEYRRELEELRARGVEPDDAFFERHDIFDVKLS
jgi:quercetin dioxygenase-like cupin family protein